MEFDRGKIIPIPEVVHRDLNHANGLRGCSELIGGRATAFYRRCESWRSKAFNITAIVPFGGTDYQVTMIIGASFSNNAVLFPRRIPYDFPLLESMTMAALYAV